jgi:drug/metabolite transporter (DMT)-like permease
LRASAALPYAVLAVAVLAVSFGAIFVRYADAPALAVAAWRMALASAVVVPAALAFGRRRAVGEKGGVAMALGAGVLLALHFATWISSLDYIPVAQSVLLVNTAPVWVALIAWATGSDRPGPATWAAVALVLVGGAVIAGGDLVSGMPGAGHALAIAGAVAMSGYLLLARAAQRSLPFLPYVALAYGSAAVTLSVALLVSGASWHGFPAGTWVALAAMAGVSQLLGHGGYNWSLRHLRPAFVAVALTGEPLLAALLAWLLLGEAVTAATAAGGSLLLVGIALAARGERRGRGSESG